MDTAMFFLSSYCMGAALYLLCSGAAAIRDRIRSKTVKTAGLYFFIFVLSTAVQFIMEILGETGVPVLSGYLPENSGLTGTHISAVVLILVIHERLLSVDPFVSVAMGERNSRGRTYNVTVRYDQILMYAVIFLFVLPPGIFCIRAGASLAERINNFCAEEFEKKEPGTSSGTVK